MSNTYKDYLNKMKFILVRQYLLLEFAFIRLTFLSVNKHLKGNKNTSAFVFLEKSYQGAFRASCKNDHNFMSRKSLLEYKTTNILVISLDVINYYYKRIYNSYRVMVKLSGQYDRLIVIYFSAQTLAYLNPFILKLCKRKGAKVLCVLTDGSWPANQEATQRFADCFCHVSCWDTPWFPNLHKCRIIDGSFSPFPKTVECSNFQGKFIDVFFAGKIEGRPDREELLKRLQKSNFLVDFSTAETGYLSIEEYFYKLKMSKVVINNSQSTNGHVRVDQIKGRVFEALLSGSILFENKNAHTQHFFTPGVHYVEYEKPSEILELVSEYLIDYDTKGVKIATAGHEYAKKMYTGRRYWELVLNKVVGKNIV